MNGWQTRAAVVAVAAVLWLALVFFYTAPAWEMVTYRLIVEGTMLVLWLGAALGIGSLVVRRFALDEPSKGGNLLHFVTAAALGLGILSLTLLALGLAGWLNRVTAIALLVIGLIAGLSRVNAVRRQGEALSRWLTGPAGWGYLLLVIVPLLAMMTAGALLPPYLLWTPNEPHGYDVVEYHLQVPREWYELGRIVPLRHNVFSFFPFNVEMHYLLAMHLHGGPWAGMYLAQLMHGTMILLSALAACGFASRLAPAAADHGNSKTIAPVLALVAMLTTPWLSQLGAIAYDEGGFLLFGTLAIGWASIAFREPERRSRRLAVAGVFTGFACGSKLTAVPEILAAIGLLAVVFLVVRRSNEKQSLTRRLAGPFIFGIAGLLCFSPWMIRNWAWSGNPVFPELPTLLGKGHFSDVQVERWRRAHLPQPSQQSLHGRAKALWTEVIASPQFGYLLVPMALLAIVLNRRDRDVWFLGMMLFLLAVFWFGFTHLQSRFFVLAVPICALLISRLPPRIGAAIALQMAPGLILLTGQYQKIVDQFPPQLFAQVVGSENLSWMPPPAIDSVPTDARLTLVGDAKAFLYQRSMSLLSYRTIFDVDTSQTNDVIDAYAGFPTTHGSQWLCIDPAELARFEKTYQPFPAIAPQILAHREPYVIQR